MELREISQYGITSGEELIFGGGYCVACSVFPKDEPQKIELSPLFKTFDAAHKFHEYLSKTFIETGKNNVIILGVYKLEIVEL